MSMWNWLKTLLSGKPHFCVGGRENPSLMRWYLIPRNRFCNVYLHCFLRDDDNRALHDHPWWFVSILLRGGYYEHCENGQVVIRSAIGSMAFRKSTHRHRVELFRSCGAWTLVITGPKVREWGFHCKKGFVPWHEFVDRNDPGAVGPGCGE